MVQEHERAVGGWQAEWATIHAVLQSAGVALESMVEVAEGLKPGEKIVTSGTLFIDRAARGE